MPANGRWDLTRRLKLNAELNPICQLLALLGAHHILHVSGVRINSGALISSAVDILSRNTDDLQLVVSRQRTQFHILVCQDCLKNFIFVYKCSWTRL